MINGLRFPDVTVQLTGRNANAMFIIAAVRRALRRVATREELEEFTTEAMSGDYDNVLQTSMRWVDVA